MRKILALVAVTWSSATLAAAERPPAQPQKLAVLDFALAGSAHPDLARVLSDAAAAESSKVAGYQVVSQSEIVSLLGLERSKQMLGCTEDAGCMVELAGALDADRLLSGSITVIERTALMSVRLIDVRRSRTLARANTTILDASQAELVDASRRLVHEALTGRRLDTTGTLRITVDRAGAQVSVDGKDLGLSPMAGAQRLLEGPHQITVQRKGYVRWSSSVVIKAGSEVPVSVELVPISALGESSRSRLWTWGWVASGVAVAGAGAGIVFSRMASNSYDEYKSATTRTEAVDRHDETRQRATMAKVSWGIAGVAGASAVGMLVYAAISDAKAASEVAVAPTDGGAVVVVGGRF